MNDLEVLLETSMTNIVTYGVLTRAVTTAINDLTVN